jgi:hypothetical protein
LVAATSDCSEHGALPPPPSARKRSRSFNSSKPCRPTRHTAAFLPCARDVFQLEGGGAGD